MPTGLVYFMCALCDIADMVMGDIAGKRNKTVGSCCRLRVSIFLELGMGMEYGICALRFFLSLLVDSFMGPSRGLSDRPFPNFTQTVVQGSTTCQMSWN